MARNNSFGKWYLKYIVKAPVLYCAYLGLFLTVLLAMTVNFQLDVRQTFEAEINGNEIVVRNETPIEIRDNKVYVYTDKNQEVMLFYVKSTEYSEGVLRLFLQENPDGISGKVTVEMISDSKTLLRRIFS